MMNDEDYNEEFNYSVICSRQKSEAEPQITWVSHPSGEYSSTLMMSIWLIFCVYLTLFIEAANSNNCC